ILNSYLDILQLPPTRPYGLSAKKNKYTHGDAGIKSRLVQNKIVNHRRQPDLPIIPVLWNASYSFERFVNIND
ncbi:hypothetical protein, partial [Salmonella enterica]|uniref:hypothetical protein n=1 Tax=Salmonella enterica TaxID=28901 RepID=UPI0006A46B49